MRQTVSEQKTLMTEVADFDQHFSSAVDKFRKEARRKEQIIIGSSQSSSPSPSSFSASSAPPLAVIGSISVSIPRLTEHKLSDAETNFKLSALTMGSNSDEIMI